MIQSKSQKTNVSLSIPSAVRHMLTLSLFACFAVFVATIEIERKTLDPNIAQKNLREAGVLFPLEKWNFALFDCPSFEISEKCKTGGTIQGSFPLNWPEAAEFSKNAKGFAIARATHELNNSQKQWIQDKENVSVVLPRNVQNATRTPGHALPLSMGIGTASEIVTNKNSLLQEKRIEIEFDFSNLPMFGPRELPGALVDADSIGAYQSLPARQLAANHLVMQLGIGFPLFIAVLAVVLDHSMPFALLSIFGILRSMRSFVPFWLENNSGNATFLQPIFFMLSGLCFAAFVLFTLEMTHIARLSRKNIAILVASLVVALLATGYWVPDGWTTSDLYADIGMGIVGFVAVGLALNRLRQREHKTECEVENMNSFSFSDTGWNAVSLLMLAIASALMTTVNIDDLIASFRGQFKTIIDWRHIAIFPAMTAAALLEIGFTSKKVLLVAREMTEKAIQDKELQTAREFQQQILPPTKFSDEHWQWRAVYKSASKLGGDWFDVREITFHDGKKFLAVGLVDVTGHGAGAAMVTAIVAAIWGLWCKDIALKSAPKSEEDKGAFLTEACERLQAALSASRKEASGTGVFALLCAKSRSVTYCTIGHPAIIATNNKTISTLLTSNSAFGHAQHLSEHHWKIGHKILEQEERLIFYSDGIVPIETDAFGFIQSFRRRLKKENFSVPTEFFKAVRKAKQAHRINRKIEDDVTVLVVGIK